MKAALNHLRFAERHVVAQIVKAKLAVGHICNVAVIRRLALCAVHSAEHRADREPHEAVYLPHLLGVALCEVVVHRYDMDTLARQRVEVGGQGRDQSLALAGAHLGNTPLMQYDAADKLGGEMLHPQHPASGLAHRGKGLRQKFVKALPLRKPPPEFICLISERRIAE